jgi:chromatin remodeling complex protein RSC6
MNIHIHEHANPHTPINTHSDPLESVSGNLLESIYDHFSKLQEEEHVAQLREYSRIKRSERLKQTLLEQEDVEFDRESNTLAMAELDGIDSGYEGGTRRRKPTGRGVDSTPSPSRSAETEKKASAAVASGSAKKKMNKKKKKRVPRTRKLPAAHAKEDRKATVSTVDGSGEESGDAEALYGSSQILREAAHLLTKIQVIPIVSPKV